MTKIILIFLFFNVLTIRTFCQIDSLKITQQFYEVTKITDSLQTQVTQLKETKNNFDLWSITPWTLTCITIFVSVMVYKREVSYKNVSFITESNKMKVTDPSLWAFYDTYKADFDTDIIISEGNFQIIGVQEFESKSKGELTVTGIGELSLNGNILNNNNYSNIKIKKDDKLIINGNFTFSLLNNASLSMKGTESKKLEGKIRGYCYFNLNSFELVFNYNKIIGTSNKVWEDYMINSMIDSTYFYKISKKESEGYLYEKEYRERLTDFLVIAELCKTKQIKEINQIIDSKERLILAYRSGLIRPTSDFNSLKPYLN